MGRAMADPRRCWPCFADAPPPRAAGVSPAGVSPPVNGTSARTPASLDRCRAAVTARGVASLFLSTHGDAPFSPPAEAEPGDVGAAPALGLSDGNATWTAKHVTRERGWKSSR